jgi:N-acetylmuramoyl-L-alanine amidase
MRRDFRAIRPLMISTMFILFTLTTTAQSDTSTQRNIQQLIDRESAAPGWQVSQVVKSGNELLIYFNSDQSYLKGGITETTAEMLMELLVHLSTETGTQNIRLLARDRNSGQWKSLDEFVATPPRTPYVQPANLDNYPAIEGHNNFVQQRVFPGAGQPLSGGPLSGKTVWLSPGHGWQNTGSGFLTQRGTTNQLVEDFITAESVDYYLLNYLMNAGANVWSVRERDLNTKEVIVNNDQGSPAYVETGSWTDGSIAGYGGTYRVATADAAETSTAVYTPTIDSSGLYWVSVRFISGANRATDTKYTINHSGGSTTFLLNQEVHSDTWIYLGQFYFLAGGSYSIVISNQSAEGGQAIIADAVRLGGGVGATPDCINGGAASGKPRFEESARQYARFQGHPCREDVTVRPVYTEWELNKGIPTEINNAIYVAWHTNAAGGTGTETYRYNGLGASQPVITAGSTELRGYIHDQVIADIRGGWKPAWTDRGKKEANFGELRELLTIPGILMELAFHDNVNDAADLRAPEFRRIAARAVYKGIVKFFNNRDGIPLAILPEEPTRVIAKNIGSAQIQLNWQAPLTGGIYGDAATGYRVYVSENGKGFGNAASTATNSFTFTGIPGKTYFFKVTATNAGGESFASSVVAARTPTGVNPVRYLIVDGFDRLDASAMILKNEGGALGNVRRMFLEKMNSYDYMVEHGNGLTTCNIAFDGAQNDVVSAGEVTLGDYFAVDWYTGEESTADRSLDNIEKQKISEYLDNGGRLLLSGAEIAWDIGRAASANADLPFFNNYLKAAYVGDGAGTYNFAGTPVLFTGNNGTFGNGTNYFNVDFPDRITNFSSSSQVVLNYVGGTADGAGVGYNGTYNLLYFGFPIEAVVNDVTRNNLICASANYLAQATTLPVTGFVLQGNPHDGYNQLKWTTYSEINTKHFIVERSTDGVNYVSIGNAVFAKGIGGNGAIYTITDNTVLPLAYYRITAVDHDGYSSYSNIVVIRNNRIKTLYVVQNPATDAIKIRFNVTGTANFSLVNAMGQVVHRSTASVNNGQQVSIPVSNLAKGIYWLSATMEGNNLQTYKIMVQ